MDGPLAAAVGPLPMPVALGGLLVFASRRCVLALAVVPSVALVGTHSRLHTALEGCPALVDDGRPDHLSPGRWTPHVTLAHGLGADQVGMAVALLGRFQEVAGEAVAVRRWDAGERRTWNLPAG